LQALLSLDRSFERVGSPVEGSTEGIPDDLEDETMISFDGSTQNLMVLRA
jgi:hypothetical protein